MEKRPGRIMSRLKRLVRWIQFYFLLSSIFCDIDVLYGAFFFLLIALYIFYDTSQPDRTFSTNKYLYWKTIVVWQMLQP